MYPILEEGVFVGTFRCKDSGAVRCYIENAEGKRYYISRRLYEALLEADGKRPLALPDRGRRILPRLKRDGLVRTSRFVRDGGITYRFILSREGRITPLRRAMCRLINAVLPFISVLTFAAGLYLMLSGGCLSGDDLNVWLYYGLFIASILLHEAGHRAAGIAYGYKLGTTGIFMLGIIPIGAYVSYKEKKILRRAQEIQFSLAGVEVNLLLAGLCFILSALSGTLSGTTHPIALINVILVASNLLPVEGLDGESALSVMLGVESIGAAAPRALADRRFRYSLLHSGLSGFLFYCLLAFTRASKVIYVVLVVAGSIYAGIVAI